ncbi:MAG TPA: ABC transporter substrate-binding protein, partial [Reyranella sp.]|nr:ABC transporter substrate-binding protein [Reyranella sp.]
MKRRLLSLSTLLAACAVSVAPAALAQEKVLRIAMTASDIPTTSGMPNNGFEGMRFLGFPIFQGLIGFDLATTGPVKLLPHLAEKWEQAADDKKTWIFHLRKGVKFHDGTDFNADAVVWNLDRFFNKDSPQFE